MRTALAAAALLCLAACGSAASTIGPLTIVPPDGWLVTDRGPVTLKVTNGTLGDESGTTAGTATAVFDIYVDSTQSLGDLREVFAENRVRVTEEEIEVDGYDAVMLHARASSLGPPTITVFIGDWNVRIVYRAAYPDAQAAFDRHREGFREALGSISFEGRPDPKA